jgi:hypothetical protein
MRSRGWLSIAAVIVLLVGLPLAVLLDLRSLTQTALKTQTTDLNAVITGIRNFYSTDIVGRVLAGPGQTMVTSDFENHPGAIPIPATFSLALGGVVGQYQDNIRYRFFSDYPFRNRAPHAFDDFERSALAELRKTRDPNEKLYASEWHGLTSTVRIVAPVIMGPTCVACHNTDPNSTKRDWKVGDVRGLQELSIEQPLPLNLFAFKYLLIYFAFAAIVGFSFITIERRQAATIATSNAFLAGISAKLARYLSPQIYSRSSSRISKTSPRRPNGSNPKNSPHSSMNISPRCPPSPSSGAARSTNSSVMRCSCFSAIPKPRASPKMRRPPCAWRSRCRRVLPNSTSPGA